MKKTLLMVAFLLSVFGTTNVKAQNSLFLEAPSCVSVLSDNLVRTAFPGQKYVSFHRSGTGNYFLYFDKGTFCRRLNLPYEFYVKDFRVMDDTVFFCGRTVENNEYIGIFGYFPLSLFGMSAGNLTYAQFSNLNPGEMVMIRVYRDNPSGKATVVLKGWDFTSSYMYQNSYAFILQENGPVWNGYYNNSSSYKLGGIAVTDDYIVTAAEAPTQDKIYVIRVDKSNLSLCYYVGIDEPTYNTGIGVENLENNMAAINDLVYDNKKNTFYDRIYTLDMNNISIIQTQDVPLPEKSFPIDMVYLDGVQKLMMLQETAVSSIPYWYIYHLDPFNNSYVADIEYNPVNKSYAIDKDTPVSYIAATKTASHQQSYYIRDVTTLSAQCMHYDKVTVQPVKKNMPIPPNLWLNNHSVKTISFPVTIEDTKISIGCKD